MLPDFGSIRVSKLGSGMEPACLARNDYSI